MGESPIQAALQPVQIGAVHDQDQLYDRQYLEHTRRGRLFWIVHMSIAHIHEESNVEDETYQFPERDPDGHGEDGDP